MPLITSPCGVGGHQADKHLKPEELRAIECGVRYTSRTFSAKASIFHHHAQNMIDWVLDTREADPVWQSVNHTKVNTLGEEATVKFQVSSFMFQVNYCHLHQQKQEAHLTRQLDLTIGYRWQDRMGTYTTTTGEVKSYHPYSILDARLAWNTNCYSLYLEGNNLTNHQYVDYGNVPQPGAWMIAGIRCNL